MGAWSSGGLARVASMPEETFTDLKKVWPSVGDPWTSCMWTFQAAVLKRGLASKPRKSSIALPCPCANWNRF